MPLNLGTGGTKDFVKFNSKSDKWYVGGDQEIGRPIFIADFDNIAIGWLRFREGQVPERCIFPALDREAPKPAEDFKKGFVVVTLYSEKFFGGAVEFSSTSLHVRNAVNEIYDTWERERDQHPGELPVIATTGSETKKDRYGTNFKPVFAIVKWVPRPAELPDELPVNPADVWQGDLLTPAKPQLVTPRPAADALQPEF
jgi:hypothetical protein